MGGLTPYVADSDFTLYVGDCIDTLRQMPDASVHCCVTSPPYWGLRDYGTAAWDGGDPDCDHQHDTKHQQQGATSQRQGRSNASEQRNENFRDVCGKCGATRVDLQIGLEQTPDEYVARMVDVFREVRRVLRDDGTLWLNLGDSYLGGGGYSPGSPSNVARQEGVAAGNRKAGAFVVANEDRYEARKRQVSMPAGMKPKDLVGIPWRVAFALQADGWVLRSDIVWSKPNPMPESVTDRPTKAHEMVFMLSKAKWVGPERGRYEDISDEDARWLALLFDAEGNVVVKKARNGERTQYGAQIAFGNTNRALIEAAQKIVGAGSIHEREGTNAPMFYWQMTGQQARDLLHRIYPFLIVKPRQAAVAIHMQDVIAEPKKRPGGYRTDEHTAFLDRCWETVKALNSFEHPDISWVPVPRYGKWTTQPYFFDQEAVREPHSPDGRNKTVHDHQVNGSHENYANMGTAQERWPNGGRNVRSVWEIATQPYAEAHFATFPQELPRKCISAGTSEHGVCPDCGAPWERTTMSGPDPNRAQAKRALEIAANAGLTDEHLDALRACGISDVGKALVTTNGAGRNDLAVQTLADEARAALGGYAREFLIRGRTETTGWEPTCDHGHDPVPATCLDPFMGSGTTAYVARALGRRSVGIELNPEYADLCAKRMQQLSLLA